MKLLWWVFPWIPCCILFPLSTIMVNCQKVPALYVFGDSTVDTGNNNFVKSIARANFPPYGRDFPGQTATGRFSDGKLISDLLSEKLGFSGAVPRFLDPQSRGETSVKEVCFASAASGYYDPTSKVYNVISMSQQVEFFRQYKSELAELVGAQNSVKIISEALYLVSAGSNDIVLSYTLNPFNQKRYSAAEFTQIIRRSFVKFMEEMYAEGARRFLVLNPLPVGCLPGIITLFSKNGQCVSEITEIGRATSDLFEAALLSLSTRLPGFTFAFVDMSSILQQLSQDPSSFGFVEGRKGCCGTGLIEFGFLCNKKSVTCADTSKYVYWDSVHPTTAAYSVVAAAAFNQFLCKLEIM